MSSSGAFTSTRPLTATDIRDDGPPFPIMEDPSGPARIRPAAWLVGLIAALCYMAVGAFLALHSDLVVLDALSRTAHAAAVWHDHPSKLATLGFVWPPISTLTLLPVTLPMALARHGLAAPIVSALAMGWVVAVVTRAVRAMLGNGLAAWACIGAFAVNPIIIYYGANGMSEVWALLFPMISLTCLMRWEREQSIGPLVFASLAATCAALARYELAVVPLLVAGAVFAVIMQREHDGPKARALALFTLIAPAYALIVWMGFNWMVQGSPLWFLTAGGQVGTVTGSASTVGGGAVVAHLHRLMADLWVIGAQAAISPLLIATVAVLIVMAVRLRRRFALIVAAFVLTNLVTNVALITVSGNAWFVNLRFNMRALGVVILAAAWVMQELQRGGHLRLRALWVRSTIVLLMLGLLSTTLTLRHYPVQFGGRAFLRAIASRQRLDGQTIDGQPQGCDGARAMGSWIAHHIHSANAVLADDSSTYAVLLYSGHPERFLDRADHGDAYFLDQLDNPGRATRYLLASDFTSCTGVTSDLVAQRFGGIPTATTAGLALVHQTTGFKLFAVTANKLKEPAA